MLFHASAAAALGDDAALELADWACRRLLHLNTGAHAFAAAPGADRVCPSKLGSLVGTLLDCT